MSCKRCGHDDKHRKLHLILFGVGAFIVLVLLVIFIIWAILQPTKPKFTLQDATLYAFNLSSTTPNTLTITMQITLSSHNPNSRIGIYYKSLEAYASYYGQQVTLPTTLLDTYQGHDGFTVWSPLPLYGTAVPVSPFALSSLQQDRDNGVVMVNVKVNGRVNWKVGTWISGTYHLYVNCPAYIKVATAGNQSGGIAPAVKFQLLQRCSVNV